MSLWQMQKVFSIYIILFFRDEMPHPEPVRRNASPSPHLSPEHTVMEEIQSSINKIVRIRSREVLDERDTLILVINAMTDELESVNQEITSVAARRDILLEQLELERKWICALECTLKDNNISLPKYPRRL